MSEPHVETEITDAAAAARRSEAQVRHCYSTWSRRYYDEYYGEAAPHPPVHREILRELIVGSGARSLLDAGCGPASFLRDVTDLELDLYGFDLTPEMVEEARRVLGPRGVPGARLWEGSVLDPLAFRCPAEPARRFGAAVCVGVLPHVPADADDAVVRALADAVEPGGLVVAEARNQLFGLFTMNRYSHELVRDTLVGADGLRARVSDAEAPGLERALQRLEGMFRTDLPPVRGGHAGEPGYDEVLSRTHNPLLLAEAFRRAGLVDVETLYYHFHALPPMLEAEAPRLFREASVAMEDPRDWRGLVMASAFLVAGRRP
jgi:SAM-dependent methyltransferase